MAIVRVQIAREINGAPAVGKWQVYRGGYFSVSGSPVPSTNTQNALSALFDGSGQDNSNALFSYQSYRTGAGSERLKTWTLDPGTGLWTLAADILRAVPLYAPVGTPYRRLPLQCAVAVGYRADLGAGVPRQRGRSRFFLGPLIAGGGVILDSSDNTGGPRLAPSAVDKLTSNTKAMYLALKNQGWELGVRSLGGSTLAPVAEFYVDDVIDTMRSRRTWQTYQQRVTA